MKPNPYHCSICKLPRSGHNHTKCSKILQREYAAKPKVEYKPREAS